MIQRESTGQLKRTREGHVPATWTQEEAISYECASEAITHAMAIVSAEIAAHDHDDPKGLSDLRARRAVMAAQRSGLHVLGTEALKAIRVEYGALVRAETRKRAEAIT